MDELLERIYALFYEALPDDGSRLRRGRALIAVLIGAAILLSVCWGTVSWLGIPELIASARAQPTPAVEEVAVVLPTATLVPPTPTPELPTPTPEPTPTPTREVAVEATTTPVVEATDTPVPTATAVALSSPEEAWPAGWPKTADEFLAWVTEGQPVSDGTWMAIEVGEIHHPPGEPTAWAVAREKDTSGYIVPYWVRNPSGCLQDGWMHSKEDRDTFGRKEPPEAVGSGIPTMDVWTGLLEGAVFRPCVDTTEEVKVPSTSWPQTAPEFLAWVTEGQPQSDGTWIPIELAEIHRPPGEPTAWAVAREKDMSGYITPFWVRNPSGCIQDGWMHHKTDRDAYGRTYPPEAVGSGIPNQDVWVGLAEGVTFRQCRE